MFTYNLEDDRCGVPASVARKLVHKLGSFSVQGRGDAAAQAMLRDARLLEDAGADLLLLECVPSSLAAEITANAKIPVIGIGAGPDVDGQILVIYDILGIWPGRKPRFVRDYMQGAADIESAVRTYVDSVRDCSYPAPEHCFS